MDYFDIFMFDNVKPDLKIILCPPNKAVFKVKVLHFVMSIPIPKVPKGRGCADIFTV